MKGEAAAAAAKLGGFPDDQLVTAVAVGLGESGLNIAAHNKESDSLGWLQINKREHPDLFSKLQTGYEWLVPEVNAQMAKKVYDDAGESWGPWQAYTGPDGKGSDGPYREYLKEAQDAVNLLNQGLAGKTKAQQTAYLKSLVKPYDEVAGYYYLGVGSQDIANAIGDVGQRTADVTQGSGAAVASAVSDLVKEFTAISNFFQSLLLPSTWIRIGAGTIGTMLIIAGMIALGKEASAQS
jgi:hypothetical protein